MKTALLRGAVALLVVIGVVALSLTAEAATKRASKGPSIQGTYKLISRTLPNGTVQRPPDIIGLFTYTKSQAMKFGLFYQLPCTPEQHEATRYHETIEQIVYAKYWLNTNIFLFLGGRSARVLSASIAIASVAAPANHVAKKGLTAGG